MKIQEGLTYDDVLLVPQRSFIDHRSQVSIRTKLTRHISLNIPFISANMDTVTEAPMAIALAREGGIGIIHRFMTIEEEVAHVNKVKRSVGFIVDNPYTLTPDTPLSKIIAKAKRLDVNSFAIVDGKNKLLGFLSRRDYWFEANLNKIARDLMTPLKKLVTGKTNITIEGAKKLFHQHKIEKLPLIDREGYVRGLITARSMPFTIKVPHFVIWGMSPKNTSWETSFSVCLLMRVAVTLKGEENVSPFSRASRGVIIDAPNE